MLRALLETAKEGCCVDCGYSYPRQAMDFDHRPGVVKRFDLSKSLGTRYALDTVREEIAKCDLVCANCHRIRTEARRPSPKKDASKQTLVYRELRDWVNSIKNTPCEGCHRIFAPTQMDFDHIDPSSKVRAVTMMIQRRYSRGTILEEIKKCRLLCVVCHRLRAD